MNDVSPAFDSTGRPANNANSVAAPESNSRSYRAMRRKVQTGFGVAFICLTLVAAASYWSVQRLIGDQQSLRHTHEAIDNLDGLVSAMAEAESAQRGFVVTGADVYLQLNQQANEAAGRMLGTLRDLAIDNSAQTSRLESVAQLMELRMAANAKIMELRRAQGFKSAQGWIGAGQGRQLQQQLRAAISDAKGAELQLLAQRELRSAQTVSVAKFAIMSGGAIALSIMGWALVALRRDFAGRQRAEEELDRFFSLSLDFLCISSVDGYFKRVSPAVTDILGWSVEEFLARPYLDFIHPDDRQATVREVERQIKMGEKVFRFENRYRHKDGTWRTFSWRSIPQADGLMYATARDVTDSKRVETELRNSKDQLEQRVRERTADLLRTTESLEEEVDRRTEAQHKLHAQLQRLHLLNQITAGIAERQDNKSIFGIVTRALEEELPVDFVCILLFDANSNQLTVSSTGAHCAELANVLGLHEGASVDLGENGFSHCARGAVVYEQDLSGDRQPFSQRFVHCNLRALLGAPMRIEDKLFGVLLVARSLPNSFDSSECEFLRQLCEHVAVAAHQAQLYGALQLAYEDLRQTQQAVMQQERLRVLGQMASGIAHDINNAITPVSIYANVLLKKEPNLSEKGRGFLQIIQQSINDVAATVTRMREFYRPRDTNAFAPVELNKLISQVVDLTRVRWSDMPQQRGIVINMQVELADSLPGIMGVDSEIREALTNLVFNAVDAMPNGGTLTLRTSTGGPDGIPESNMAEGKERAQFVHVDVVDTGVGMDEETRRHCLELFFTTKGERGTGLGLAMVYGTVQRHDGEVDIVSEVGKGTRVRLSFPAVMAFGLAQSAAALQPLGELCILLVDDDPVLLKSLCEFLRGEGHQVTAAGGGQEGINAFTAAREQGIGFDVVITDLGMPFVDGGQVAFAVKAASPTTPVILLTGWGHRLLSEGGAPAYVDRVLAKPPRSSELHVALVELTSRSAKQSETQEMIATMVDESPNQ